MFVDEVILKVEAGSGGDGCLAFRREKFVPMGGPFGGNGGKGADIIFEVDEGLKTLIDLRYQKLIRGKKGENGSGKNKNGKSAEDMIVKVPQGTIVTDKETGYILADLKAKGDRYVVASGGRGGRGNVAFRTQSNPCPNFAENGEPGEERILKVELKLLADVGLVGMPSVGKSTIISKISKAKPKIAEYHFTTLTPNLGVVKASDDRSYVVADLPGLIKGASRGEGLGDRFLKHIERTKIIAHVIDMSAVEGRNPIDDYNIIRNELKEFSEKLIQKEEIIVANKMDHPASKKNLERFKKEIKKEVIEISAIDGVGLDKLINRLADIVYEIPNSDLIEPKEMESFVLYKFKKEEPFSISKEDGIYIIKGKEIEKLLKMTNFGTMEARERFARKLRGMGIDDRLREAGIKDKDMVRILDYEFEFRN